MADKSLNKSELVAKIAAATNQSQSTVDSVLNGFFDALANGPVSASDPRSQASEMLGGDLVGPSGGPK